MLETTLVRSCSTPPCLLLMLEERTFFLFFFPPDCWRTTKKGKCGGLSTSFILFSIMLATVFSSIELWLCSDISCCSWVRPSVSVLFSTAKALRRKHWDKVSIEARTGRTERTGVQIMTLLELNCYCRSQLSLSQSDISPITRGGLGSVSPDSSHFSKRINIKRIFHLNSIHRTKVNSDVIQPTISMTFHEFCKNLLKIPNSAPFTCNSYQAWVQWVRVRWEWTGRLAIQCISWYKQSEYSQSFLLSYKFPNSVRKSSLSLPTYIHSFTSVLYVVSSILSLT